MAAKHSDSSICKKEGCNRAAAKNRLYCNPCRNQKEKEADLAAWSYRKHKSNAKRRGILFTISLEYFRAWAAETEILSGAGRSATSYHVDRIIDALGYVEGNLQKLTNTENIRKENLRRKKLVFDYELYRRKQLNLFDSQEQEDLSVFRYVDASIDLSATAPDDGPPF